MRRTGIVGGTLVLTTLALGCGGAEPPPQTPAAEMVPPEGATPPAVAEAEAAPADVEWAAMNEAQRRDYMKTVVLPKMTEVLQAGDPEEFAEVTCKTCHGASAEAGTFEMPNPDLPKLDPANGFAEEKEEHPEMVDFMMKKVVPEMATLLGVQPYDPATQQGFGCFQCHTMEKH